MTSPARPGAPAATVGRRGAPTIRQVAALAGVSRATASRVINGGHLVSPETRKAVEAAIAELGFAPNPVARNLANRRTGSVALVVPEPNQRLLTDPFFASIINGISMTLEDSDLQMVLLIARPGGRTDRLVGYLTTGNVDGAVIASHHSDDLFNRQLVDAGLPCVYIGRPLDLARAHYVDMDNAQGARLATEHLVASGRRRIGTITGPATMAPGLDRLTGWRAALTEVGLPTDAIAVGDFTTRGGYAAMEQLLTDHPDLDAVFAASDLMASGALAAISARGLSVPDDIAVFGFDDLGAAETTDPPLSTVRHPVTEMAARAGALLVALLAGEDIGDEPVLFTPRLVLRESV